MATKAASASERKLWTIDDLKDFLGYATTECAVRAIRELAVPFLWFGAGEPDLGKRGSARRLRFVPGLVEAWAARSSRVVDPAAPEPAPPALKVAAIVPGAPTMMNARRRGPRRGA